MNEEQKQTVARWFAAGASLDEIQKRIKSEFGVHMTYLDVRLMVAELPQPVEEEPEDDSSSRQNPPSPSDGDGQPRAPDDADAGRTEAGPAPGEGEASAVETEQLPPEGTAAGEVTVNVDALMIPGTLASGDVTFSDGQTGKWYLDRMGRLGLGGDLPEGYRPNPADAAVFRSKLMSALQAKGLC